MGREGGGMAMRGEGFRDGGWERISRLKSNQGYAEEVQGQRGYRGAVVLGKRNGHMALARRTRSDCIISKAVISHDLTFPRFFFRFTLTCLYRHLHDYRIAHENNNVTKILPHLLAQSIPSMNP